MNDNRRLLQFINSTDNISLLYGNVSYPTPCFDRSFYRNFRTAMLWSDIVTDVLGTVLNFWLLLAILTSAELRLRMRNRLLSSVCIQNLFECLVYLPFSLYMYTVARNEAWTCPKTMAMNLIFYINEFISNWNLVFILALAVVTLLGADLFLTRLSRWLSIAVTSGVLLMPWVLSVLIVPPTIFTQSEQILFTRASNNETVCWTRMFDVRKILYVLNIGVPAILIAICLAATVFLNWKKNVRERTGVGEMARQLIGGSNEAEGVLPYVAMTVIMYACDFGLVLNIIRSSYYKDCVTVTLKAAVNILEGFKVLLLPMTFLLFPEIRYRVKKTQELLRPAHRTSGLSISYVREG
ncbi:hypothetical protein Bpfe_028562 [Biomphalaria pfeifferi]|uniref:G-protein coupled receptors family 1 profile domain-containing protein n=1 Tax=Biomphalaria pfeifferi TaxID=112525 RepID=A0AAD8AT58_BIOPF|nr:hypothetical protein Bpfe_028562 [Biomphalaria pfeifferi]